MKLYMKSSSIIFQKMGDEILSPTYNNWASAYYINQGGKIVNLAAYSAIGVSDAINCEGFSKLRITGCVGQTNEYASICAFYTSQPVVGSIDNRAGYQVMTGETTYEVDIPANAKFLCVVNAEFNSSGVIPSGSAPVYTLVP